MFKSVQEIKQALANSLAKDRHHLNRQFKQLALNDSIEIAQLTKKITDNPQFFSKLTASVLKVNQNKKLVPKIIYNQQLPITKKRKQLLQLIKNNQVVIIAGETGSGKTTQIPKICLEAGRGVFGRIGCTQPRRLAARSVAERLSEELGSSLGQLVGYQVRFHDLVQNTSIIKIMTDGILLAEVQNDPFLTKYDTIIIDEAHERSINIDFLLGILKTILIKRTDLKLIITSATIDTKRFSEHFDNAPVVEVSGRTYPVEIRYNPLTSYIDNAENEFEQDVTTAILHALDELELEDPFGDVLIFLVGERDIKETAEIIRKHNIKNIEIVPLYARLSMAEQKKVFKESTKRRIILATNVAETSLTIPGIKFVIDPGFVRISRYSIRSKVQRLPIEKISQASANQRAGRCGRVCAGICIRLYEQEDFNERAEFTTPEIHRTSLATVILQMNVMKLGSVNNFPFIEAPDNKALNDGFRQLQELGALDKSKRLTAEGKQLAKLPLDPKVAKMVMAGQKNAVLAEVLIIAALLSVQDPRDLNESNRKAANKAHKQFIDERSDFIFFLNLWRFYAEKRADLNQNKLRKLCKTNFLSYLRMKEWHDLFIQLTKSLNRTGIKVAQLHSYEKIIKKRGDEQYTIERLSDMHSIAMHCSLMAGLLGNISTRNDDKSYLGARGTKLFIHPSSVLFSKKPKWLLSSELIETTKLYARNNAIIDVRWIESIASHLLKHSYAEPHWQKNSGQVSAYQSISLYGLPIVNKRRCNYGLINSEDAHKIFIRHALVMGEMNSRVKFFKHNQKLITEIKQLEAKLRRPDFLIDDEVLYDFYYSKIPNNIYSLPTFETWVKKAEQATPELIKSLFLEQSFLLKQSINTGLEYDFPNQLQIKNNLKIDVDYCFEPGKQQDGLMVKLPISSLNLINAEDFQWLTPGLLKEKVALYIKHLPKQLRKQFVPVPQYVDLALQEMSADKTESFIDQLVLVLNRLIANKQNTKLTISNFLGVNLPSHLLPFYQLEDAKGKIIATGLDLDNLKKDYQYLVEKQIQQTSNQQNIKITKWDFGDLKSEQIIKSKSGQIVAYPSLQIINQTIELTLIADRRLAQAQHAKAVLKLLTDNLADKHKYLTNKLSLQKACLCYAPYGTCQDLTKQIIARALNSLVPNPYLIKTQTQYKDALQELKDKWVTQSQAIAKQVTIILIYHQQVAKKIKVKKNPRWLASATDICLQLDNLISKDFVRTTPDKWFKRLPVYLQAIEKRLEKIDINPNKDQLNILKITPLLNSFTELSNITVYEKSSQLVDVRWQIEELRVSVFSQPIKTLLPVSIKRIEKNLQNI